LDRLCLTDDQWSKIVDLLPGKPGDPGRSGTDNRLWLLLGSGVVGLGAWVASVEGIWCDGGSAGPTGSREEFPPSWLHWTCSTSPA